MSGSDEQDGGRLVDPSREPLPEGTVSSDRGPQQIPVLRWVIRLLLALATVSVIVPGPVGVGFGVAALIVLVATPLVRVAWLAVEWAREDDWRFVATAAALLAVVATGALLSVLGVRG